MEECEIWKQIKGCDDFMIGDRGTLLSRRRGCWRIMSNTNQNGWYLTVNLKNNNGKRITRRIHRLVYEAFVGDIPKGFDVHHKDGNKQNNRVENLVAISEYEHHLMHAAENPNIYQGMRNYNKYIRPKAIYQYDLEGTFITAYPNAKEAYRATGICSRNILQVANKTEYKPGKIRKQAGGYIWKIAE